MTKKKKARIQLRDGKDKEVRMHIPGDGSFLGVNYEARRGWNVTHLPTGLRAFPGCFESKQEALSALTELQPYHKAWSDPKTARDLAEPLLLKAAKRIGRSLVRVN